MFQEVKINYFHPGMKIGLENIRNAWLLEEEPIKLTTALHRGNLVFRFPGSGRRISYRRLKKGLLKKIIIIRQPLYLLPF